VAFADRDIAATALEAGTRSPEKGVRDVAGLDVALRRPEGGSGGVAAVVEIEGRPTSPDPVHRPAPARTRLQRWPARRNRIECSICRATPPPPSPKPQGDRAGAQGNVRPAEKQEAIARLRAAGRRVLMVGDGLNDGPALAAADASIAPGRRAMSASRPPTWCSCRIRCWRLPRAVRAARRTMRVVRQNFALAIGYKRLRFRSRSLALVTPLVAAVAMSTSSLIVIANSLRLARATR
jgi:Cu2+-exporting ATPase